MINEKEINNEVIDTGLESLMFTFTILGIEVEKDELIQKYISPNEMFNDNKIVRALKDKKIKAKKKKYNLEKLKNSSTPFIVKIDDEYHLVLKIVGDSMALLNTKERKTEKLDLLEFNKRWSGEVIALKKDINEVKEGLFNIKWFIPTIKKFKKPLIVVLLASLMIQVLSIIMPMVMQVIIDKVLIHRTQSTLNVLCSILVFVLICDIILNLSRTYIFTHTTSKIDIILGSRLVNHLYRLPLKYFESRRVGDTIARVREIDNIRQFLTGAPLTSILDVSFIFVYFIIMFFYSKSLSIIVLLSLPVFAALSLIITPLLKSRIDERFYRGAESQSFLVESVNGSQTLKAFALEDEFQRRWEGYLSKYAKASFKTVILGNYASNVAQFIQKILDVIILWYGAILVMDNSITIGQLVAFRMLSSRVSEPVLRLVQMWNDFQQTGVSLNRIGDIFNTPTEDSIDTKKIRVQNMQGKVEFENVFFSYNAGQAPVLKDVCFEIKSGEIIGIVGKSGSGKSTISKLIQRLYIADEGRILIDNIDINMIDQFWLRRQIGVVLQENFLFTGSVRENIAINKRNATMSEIVNASKVAGAHEFISRLSEGYDTVIGENGIGLSGGQKQRLAIARALITNPRILIFDEATSALDYESERIIQNNLKEICKGRTVIIIAHRLSTLSDANRIISIDRGKIVEMGTHQELMQNKDVYYNLYMQQSRGDISVRMD
ncbi:ATP-binding cassette, subfamily B, HlyB/CyaB [Clostridium cavendishii DSM 21758]|uniref:ATP-binding cassette, subfamily B, HlyB/CyaB n=1 Tax=Clostridium cavendishii DSM 21758 TaxID=1121302 RepID=A0A1M6L197_9CLOT|nr:type I secretion system permease/ATPase [Clostridium cavendishii]SHJ64933.1 ATP-binding cassette, subfamily B, HlyB/CyaB [Clostridium cavendishii DSM 21758]